MGTDETTVSHFGQWGVAVLWIVLFGLFLFFMPFYKKSQRKPASVYFAFIVALALEMFGLPLSMYAITWLLGPILPEGVLWGHTLVQTIGLTGYYIGLVFMCTGVLLIVLGWRQIYKHYWSKEEGKGQCVTSGIYAIIRHPQYTGFFMITFGMMCEWATLPLLIMWPILLALYYRLAKREEADMEQEFGAEYQEYRRRTSMFIPLWIFNSGARQARAQARRAHA